MSEPMHPEPDPPETPFCGVAEAERRQAAYSAERITYRVQNPDVPRERCE